MPLVVILREGPLLLESKVLECLCLAVPCRAIKGFASDGILHVAIRLQRDHRTDRPTNRTDAYETESDDPHTSSRPAHLELSTVT